jgi:predicted XRE-type DNA-binding protein
MGCFLIALRRHQEQHLKESAMNTKQKKALEAAGWKFGDAADFLEMTDQERQLLDARVELALAVRRQREARNLSQKQLGALLKTSQPRIAKIERAAADVSLDQIVRALAVAGGKIEVVIGKGKVGKKAAPRTAMSIKVASAS